MKHLSVAVIAVALTLSSTVTAQNAQEQDTTKAEKLNQIVLKATRVTTENPVTFSNVTAEDLKSRNLGQDLPILLNYLPNVVTTSDAGAGIGYTGIRVRGSDATRVNVTLNGVPYNDAESQGTFWVNLPDFSSSVESVQLQRGVGTSTNGSGAFGASLNIKTTDYSDEAEVKVANSIGSFNSRKHNIQFTTGLLDDRWEFNGRASQIYSDGYIDRADSDLKSYYVSGSYVGDKTLVKAIIFGGQERTYQAYYGIDPVTLETDRTFNSAGLYIDENGNTQFYDAQVDNYNQDHYQLLLSHRFNNNWSASATLHYTKGRGYFQEYQESDFFFDAAGRTQFDVYGLDAFQANGMTVTSSDLETRRWLDNEFYGVVTNLNYKNDWIDASFGAGINQYDGEHYGEIIAGSFIQLNEPLQRFYTGNSVKNDFNAFAKANFKISSELTAFIDLQQRRVDYNTTGSDFAVDQFLTDERYDFFNPKAGAVYRFNPSNQLYGSVARAQREPSRADFQNGSPEAEDLIDYELGYRFAKPSMNVNVNLYYMDYKDQLVLTGEIDNQGVPLRANSGNSYRLGLEIDARFRITDKLFLQPNFAISQNRNQDFIIDDNGTPNNLGDTEIAYSPSVVAGNAITYSIRDNFEVSLLSKYVGEQQLDNTDSDTARLDSYFVNDFNAQYIWKPNNLVKEVTLSLLVNNILDEEYISNGYVFPGFGSFLFPQAGINFLTGVTLTF
ncbi:iron complex outermembrane recepter protein [Nonlabens sp. Hel1_33_55]|uniref:TonB-dependent receptor n=1 Tax=Nonlabens sp. Hel1_33_55 TaxID=1336802 RepID=UPI000875B040|nr:TonB-dependent receptor [Nonlabens sp. Hel1_33_55]SCY31253.1 iron complex outermembrane recepter protein [Nonlabens sp. Hel1_33_55]